MNQIPQVLKLGLAILALSALVAACGSPDGQALVESRCIACHSLTPVETAVKSEAEWRATVERMVSLGARLSASEQAAVVEHLAD
jgi:hypothetical protein